MEQNKIYLKTKNGDKKEYRVLLKLESNGVNYLIYTNEEENDYGEVKAYISSYEISEKGNPIRLKNITSEEEINFFSEILNSLQ